MHTQQYEYNPPHHTHSIPQQRTLELSNKQLQQQLKDKQQSLQLQIKILLTHRPNHINHNYHTPVEQLIEEQHKMRSYFTEKLIEKQLQIEQAKQMNQIISNYEKRIADLRSVLINKQGQISAVSYQFLRGSITRRQNLEAVNSETTEKSTLTKYAKERKKLQVEIQALQFTLNQFQKGKQQKKRRRDLVYNEQTPKKGQIIEKIVEYRESRGEFAFGRIKQDMMTDKVIKMIEEETQKYNQQADLADKLKLQLQSIEEQCNQNLRKYQKSQQQWSKSFNRNQQAVSSSPQNKVQNQLSFIKQLQEEMSNTNSQLIGSQLFSNRDTNKQQNLSELSKSIKSTSTTLKERRYRNLKQN